MLGMRIACLYTSHTNVNFSKVLKKLKLSCRGELKSSLFSGAGYGKSFPDVVQGLEHTIENLESSHILAPSFKYKVALEKQVNLFNQFQYEQY